MGPLTDDWETFKNLSDAEVTARALTDPDSPPTDEKFWKSARLVWPEKKISMTVRLDRDVLLWFRAQGKGYQTRINAVLRSYMQAHKR
jgi:uncharacterized protein (DUF4415 family)